MFLAGTGPGPCRGHSHAQRAEDRPGRPHGRIRRLEYPGPGTLLDAEAAEAGRSTWRIPLPSSSSLRLAARHSDGATIEKKPDRVTIRLDRLGPSRGKFKVEGHVAATVTLRADADGRSVVLSVRLGEPIEAIGAAGRLSGTSGLLPVAGPDNTVLKTCGFSSAPFRELVVPETDQWYAVNNSMVEYNSGGMHEVLSKMWGRWLDLGGLQGGFSLFPKQWGWTRGRVLLAIVPGHPPAPLALRPFVRGQARRNLVQRRVGLDAARGRLGQGHRALP